VNEDFTGRVMVDLSREVRNIQFELRSKQLYILDLKRTSYSNVNEIIPILLDFTIQQELNSIQLFDPIFLFNNKKAAATSEGYGESLLNFISYFEDGVLIYDADSLVGTNISGTTQIRFDQEKFNNNLTDTSTYQRGLLNIFKANSSNEKETPKKWYFFVTSSVFLVDLFKRDICFPLTKEEMEREIKENENRLKVKECKNCSQKYTEDENNLNSCKYHKGLLVCCTPGPQYKKTVTKQEVIEIQRNRLTQDIFKEFKYDCCAQQYGSEGCISDKHVEKIRKIISLKSISNRKLVTINQYGQLFAKKDLVGNFGYESFYLVYQDPSNEIVSIQSISSDSYICTTKGGVLNGKNNQEPGEYGKFKLIRNSNGTYSFASCFNSQYISAHNAISPLTSRPYSDQYIANYSFELNFH
jgi:hypothetical protein